MSLIINIIIRILVICCISVIEHHIVASLVQLLARAVDCMKANMAQLTGIHGNRLPVILFQIISQFSSLTVYKGIMATEFYGLTKCYIPFHAARPTNITKLLQYFFKFRHGI